MASIFTRARGVVAKVNEGRGAVNFRISVAGKGFQKAIITQAAIDQNDNFQFLHTLYDTIYVYIFGTRIGELVVSGMAFAETCWAGSDGPGEVLETYQNERIASKGQPVVVVFGGSSFRAFLTGSNVQITDAERNLGQWSYRLSVPPVRK